MRTVLIIPVFFFILTACQHSKKASQQSATPVLLEHIDLYPQYPGCDEFYEKEKQLECLSKKINNLISHDIKSYYKTDFQSLKDTLWVAFKIDTLGHTHYINMYSKDSLSDPEKYIQIFKKMALHIPKTKPAIYHDKAVEFEFKVPIIFTTPLKSE